MSALRTPLTTFVHGFLTAFTFLTIIPLPQSLVREKPEFSWALPWFPVIGLLIGAASAVVVWMADLFLPQMTVAALSVALLSSFSGFLHLDGLADTADGFFSSRPKDRILEIMKDSRVGPMGVILLVLLLLIKFSAFAASGYNTLLACVLVPFSGRCSIVLQMALLPYARQTGAGIGNIFATHTVKKTALFSSVFFIVVCLLLVKPLTGVVASFFLFNFLFAALCRKKIDGYTGDTLGAACESTEALTAVFMCIGLQ